MQLNGVKADKIETAYPIDTVLHKRTDPKEDDMRSSQGSRREVRWLQHCCSPLVHCTVTDRKACLNIAPQLTPGFMSSPTV